jgi:hypothetical protein
MDFVNRVFVGTIRSHLVMHLLVVLRPVIYTEDMLKLPVLIFILFRATTNYEDTKVNYQNSKLFEATFIFPMS